MRLCTWTCSVMSTEAGKAPKPGCGSRSSNDAMEVRLEGAGGRFGKPIWSEVWTQPAPGRAWNSIQMPNKSPDKTKGGLGL